MVRWEWEFIENVLSTLPCEPSELTIENCTEEIYRFLVPGTVGSLSFLDEQALRASAFIYADMLQNGRSVVTPDDITDAVGFTYQEYTGEVPSRSKMRQRSGLDEQDW